MTCAFFPIIFNMKLYACCTYASSDSARILLLLILHNLFLLDIFFLREFSFFNSLKCIYHHSYKTTEKYQNIYVSLLRQFYHHFTVAQSTFNLIVLIETVFVLFLNIPVPAFSSPDMHAHQHLHILQQCMSFCHEYT